MAGKYEPFEPRPQRWIKGWKRFCKFIFCCGVLITALKLCGENGYFGFELPDHSLPFGHIMRKTYFHGKQEAVSKRFRWSDVSTILANDRKTELTGSRLKQIVNWCGNLVLRSTIVQSLM